MVPSRAALTHDPREATARQNLAALLLKHSRFGELVVVMERQVEVFGELPGLLCVLGQALLGRSGRPEAAIRTLGFVQRTSAENRARWQWLMSTCGKPEAEHPRVGYEAASRSAHPGRDP